MPLQNQTTANVLDFGADPTGASDSRQAFQDGFDSLAVDGQFVMPAGRFKLVMTGTTPGGQVTNSYILISRSCTIVGQGAQTVLECGPDPIPAGIISEVFRIAPGATVSFDNFIAEGPTTVAPGSNPGFSAIDQATTALYLFHLPDVSGDTSFTLTRVETRNKWYTIVSLDAGVGLDPHTITVKDCKLDTYAGVLGCFTPNGGQRTLICENVKFPRSGIPAIENGPLDADGNPTMPAYSHTMYVGVGVKLRIKGCEFDEAELNCLQQWSSSGHEGTKQDAIFDDVYVGPGVKGSLYTNGYETVRFIDCALHPLGGVYYGGDCSFVQTKIGCPVAAGFGPVIATVVYEACEFGPMARIVPQGGVHSINGSTAKRGVAPDPITGVMPSMNNLFTPKASADRYRPSEININGGVYQGGIAAGEDATELICPEDGTVMMCDAEVIGRHGMGSGAIGIRQGSTGRVLVSNTPFRIPSDGGVLYAAYCAAGVAPNSLVMRGCFFSDAMPFAADSAQDVRPCEGTREEAVPSAGVLVLPDGFNYDLVHVSGTNTISNVVISNSPRPDWYIYNQRCYRGRLTIIAVDGLALAPGTGVGALDISQAVTLAAGAQQTLEHNPDLCTWKLV
jgi:hypothetical protein